MILDKRRRMWSGKPHGPFSSRGMHRHSPDDWPLAWRQRRGRLFIRFFGLFALIVVLFLGGMASLAFLLSHLMRGEGRIAVLVWFSACGLALFLSMLAGSIAIRAFRRVATPLADIMAAADAVAEGDLSVRVPVPQRGPDEFTQLVSSFNRMTEELERSDQRRRNLTADVAHELRTPLHIIQGNLEGVLDGVYRPTQEHIGVTLEETHLLARLVEDLATLSLAEAGQLPLEWERVDLSELLEDVATSFGGQAEAAGVSLKIESYPTLVVMGDVGRLDQVLSNLMSNAFRHTPDGGLVTLEARPCEGGAAIVVADTGEGIPAQDLPFVFDRFWRGDRSRMRTGRAGSGLGLAIARQLVFSHGGNIRVASEPGAGTVFTIELPSGGKKPFQPQ